MDFPNEEQLALSMSNYWKKVGVDQVHKAVPVLWWLREKGRKVVLDGGPHIMVQLRYARNETIDSYTGWDEINIKPQTNIRQGRWYYKNTVGAVSLSYDELRENSGEQKIMDITKEKNEITIDSIVENVGIKLYKDGTGNNGKDITGFGATIAVDPTTGTLAGIPRATCTWWRNQTSGDVNTTFALAGMTQLRKMYRKCTNGNQKPDLIVMGDHAYDGYETVLEGKIQIHPAKGVMADGGFSSVSYKQTEVINDSYCIDYTQVEGAAKREGMVLMLNSNFLKFVVDKETDLKVFPFERFGPQVGKTSLVLWKKNVVANNCSRLGVIYGFTG